jgi:hypothetical protein
VNIHNNRDVVYKWIQKLRNLELGFPDIQTILRLRKIYEGQSSYEAMVKDLAPQKDEIDEGEEVPKTAIRRLSRWKDSSKGRVNWV